MNIREIEIQFQIFGHEGDYRPRIEYYHDAVRALGDPLDNGLTQDSRLSVERIAYDIEMLRIISTRPLRAGRGEQHYSTEDALSSDDPQGHKIRPDRQAKAELSQLYKDYTVYFTALLANKAEDNVQARIEEANILIEDCHTMEHLLTQLAEGGLDVSGVASAANMMEHEGLRKKIMALMSRGDASRTDYMNATNSVRQARGQVEIEIHSLDAESMRVATNKLAVYEASKDIVKALTLKGLNVAGKFTEQAVSQSQQRDGLGRQ